MILKNLFTRKKPIVCGGEGSVSVVDSLGREVGCLYYTRPDSDMKVSFAWDNQKEIEREGVLKEISLADHKIKKIYEVLVRDLYVPYARKIFTRCTGYVDENKKSLDNAGREEQMRVLEKFYVHHFADMAAAAFSPSHSVKKKD